MKKLDIKKPEVRALFLLYHSIDKISDFKHLYKNFQNEQLTIFSNFQLNLFISKEEGKYYLNSTKEYLTLLPFKIRLGSEDNPFNRRVINEVRVKLFKLLSDLSIENLNDFLVKAFQEKLLFTFEYIKCCLEKGIFNLLFKRSSTENISNFSYHFTTTNNLDAQMHVYRSLFGKYKITVVGTLYPDTILNKTFIMHLEGNENDIREGISVGLHNHLY